MSAVVQPVGRTPNRDTALARSGSDVAEAFARELAEAERMLTSAPALDSEPTADSGRAPPVSDGVDLQKGDADNVAEPRTVRVTRVVLQSEGEDSSAESDGSLEPGRLSNDDLALHQTSSAAVGTLDAHRNVVSDSGSDSDRLLAELADDDVYDDEGSNSEWDTLSDNAGEHDVSAQYQLEAENERLHDELADAKGHIQAYEQQLLAYDEDINNLLNTIAVLTAEKNKAVAAHAAAREQADQDRRASVENAKRAAQRHIEEVEARHAGELQAATARVDELQAELVAARDKSSAGATAATSAPSLDAGSAADMYREQLVIARVKLADACGKNDVHIKRVRDLEEQLAQVKLRLANETAAKEDNAVAVEHFKAATVRRDQQLVMLTRKLEAAQAKIAAQEAALNAYKTGKLRKGSSVMGKLRSSLARKRSTPAPPPQ